MPKTLYGGLFFESVERATAFFKKTLGQEVDIISVSENEFGTAVEWKPRYKEMLEEMKDAREK